MLPPGFRLRTRSFRFYLTAALALTALVPLLVLALLQQQQLRAAAAQADARQLEFAQRLADDIDTYVATSRQLVELAAERLNSERPPTRAELDKVLAGTAKLFPGFMSLHYDDTQGRTLAFYPERNWRGESMVGVEHDDRWHFIELQRLGRSVISDVFKAQGATERQIVSIASPARADDGRVLGYAAAGLDLGYIAEIVHSRIGDAGFTAIVADPAGNAIYGPALDLDARPVRAIPAPVLEQLRRSRDGFLAQGAAPGEGKLLTAYVAIPELGWIVGLSQPVQQRNAAADRAAWTSGALLLLAAFLTVVVGALAARPLASAVGRLLAQVEALARREGPAPEKAEVDIGGPLELVRLQQSFRQMAADVTRSRAQLLELNQALEGQVAERTAKLSARNDELRTLHSLLMPIAPAGVAPAIDSALQAYARLLEVDSIQLELQASAAPPTQGAVAVALKERVLGAIGTTPELPASGEKRDSLVRLAGSVAIVLNNQALYAELGRQHATLTAVFESMNEGLLLVDGGGAVLYANPMAQQLLGLPANGGLRSVQEVFAAAFTNEAQGELDLDPVRLESTPRRLERRGDRRQTVDALGFAVAGEAQQRGILLRDVTREVQIERLKESLISVVAHELKTPIAAMRIQVETLARQDTEWDESFRSGLLSDMLSESQQLERLIDDWLDITRIEGGLLRLERKVVQVAGLLDRACRVVGAQYEIAVTRRIARNAECCNVDAGRVTQLLINLLTNAARYSRGPARVLVDVRRDGAWIEIAVADEGIGIPPDQLERVFDRFYQVDMSMRRRSGGTGLGLAICRGIAEAHGGSIVADSVLGQGTRFVVRLPY